MILWILAYLGGLLTILSPCILPVLPFVFSTAEQPFRKSGLPLLAGMATTFVLVSTLAVAGGAWVIHANEWGRWVALVILSLFALTLLSPTLAELISRPLTRFGGKLNLSQQQERGLFQSFLLGIATGFLWAPCAGPILGLILTGAAIHGASASTSGLLLAYALGAGTSLAAALMAGGKLLGYMKRYLGADQWVRRILGVLVLLGVVAIARGWDRGVLTGLSRVRTESLEKHLLQALHLERPDSAGGQTFEGDLPELAADSWINSPPLTRAALRGKVVLVDFWTYSCINCLRSLPYIEAWAKKYQPYGLVVIGVHTPEFAFEKNAANVRKAVQDLGITYPVAIDSHYTIWNAFGNHYWPAHYLIDSSGKIRSHHFGEGDYKETEHDIQQLLAEAHVKDVPSGVVFVLPQGAQAGAGAEIASPETYIGYDRTQNQVALPTLARDHQQDYQRPERLELNQWSLVGRWKVRGENARLTQAPGQIVFRFRARDLHLVLGPGEGKKPVRFIVHLDGKDPGNDHGTDIDFAGLGEVREQRLYQLIRQNGKIQDRTFEIEFIDPGVQAFAFTFG